MRTKLESARLKTRNRVPQNAYNALQKRLMQNSEVNFFNNYLEDPRRPADPVQSTQPFRPPIGFGGPGNERPPPRHMVSNHHIQPPHKNVSFDENSW